MTNFEPGKERLIACKKAGARIYPTNEAIAQALKTEEVGLCIMWKARAVQWQKAGINVETVAPKEGVPMYVSGFVMPKNAPNKAGAYAYLDADAGAIGAGRLRRRHGLQPHRHQRRRRRPTCRSASASPPRRRSASSISTTATWPRTMRR